ncbi:MAG: PD40 domain-containing protein [Bacteroidales bacterium]|nr:PD40 domain-containing protein [Bacteroidales bacterium]
MKQLIYLAIASLMLSCSSNSVKENFPVLSGEYLGQNQPKDSAILFAPNIVSSGLGDRDLAITPDGKEIFFTRNLGNLKYFTIFHSMQQDGIWTKPEVFKYCKDSKNNYTEPFINADGSKLFFVSDKSQNEDDERNYDIWVCDKDENNEWTEPYNLGEPVNTDQNEFYPTLTNDGTIYFNHFDEKLKAEFIYRSKLVDGEYTEPEMLNENINCGRARFNAYISPDESFIIVPVYGMPDSYGATDYYIVFRDQNDNWSQPMNMGEKVNSKNGQEWSASISPDGKYLFYMSGKTPIDIVKGNEFSSDLFDKTHNSPQNGYSDIYWISTDLIKDLKKNAVF